MVALHPALANIPQPVNVAAPFKEAENGVLIERVCNLFVSVSELTLENFSQNFLNQTETNDLEPDDDPESYLKAALNGVCA